MKRSLLHEHEGAVQAFLSAAESAFKCTSQSQRESLAMLAAFNEREAAELSERFRKRMLRVLGLAANWNAPMTAEEAGALVGWKAAGFKRRATQEGIQARQVPGFSEPVYLKREVYGLLKKLRTPTIETPARLKGAMSVIRAVRGSSIGEPVK